MRYSTPVQRAIVVLLISGLAAGLGACRGRKPAPSPTTQTASSADELPLNNIGVGDPHTANRLLRGFYSGDTDAWKWTKPVFAVSIDPPDDPGPALLILDFTAPSELMNKVGKITVTARIDGQKVGQAHYQKAGRMYFSSEVGRELIKRKPVEAEFSVDKSFPGPDAQPRALIVVGVNLEPKEPAIPTAEMQTRIARAGYQKLLEERREKLPVAEQKRMMKLFHDIPVWRHMFFHNVQIEKNPLDLWMMQQLIYDVQPDFVIETGTFRGGSALYWAHTLNGMGLDRSRVITVDVQDLTKTAATHPLWNRYVTFKLGSSTDPKIVAGIAALVKEKKVVVVLDSDHTKKHVLNELLAYAPLVSRGSYVVVEDTHMDGVPTQPDFGPGPLAAVQEFLAQGGNRDFEQDLTREALIMTFNPGGWLKRK